MSKESLVEKANVEIKVSAYGDYPYRAFVEPAVLTEWVVEQVSAIDYDHFKNKLAKTRGYDFVDALHKVRVRCLVLRIAPVRS